jgi:hypothetical protein
MLAFGLAAVPFFNGLFEKWFEIPVELPKTETASLIYVLPRTKAEMPFGGGSAPDGDNSPENNLRILKNIDLKGAVIRKADFNSANISNSVFSNADLRSADFSKAVIFFSSFINSNLSRADFRAAQLHGSDLTNAKLANTTFIQANLTASDLSNATLTNANLTDANLSDARLDTAVGLSYKQIRSAVINEFTSLPPEFKSQKAFLIEQSRKRVNELQKILSEKDLERYSFLD